MYTHAPKNYACPFCSLAEGKSDKNRRSQPGDIIYRDRDILAFIAPDWWPKNPGHVLIAPIKHYENIYTLPDRLLSKIHILEKKVALAFKTVYSAPGVSSRQHNEPAGGQDVWHYHLAVFPRYPKDELYLNTYRRKLAPSSTRFKYARKLRKYFS